MHKFAKALYHMLRNGVELKDVYGSQGVQSVNALGPLAEMLPMPERITTSQRAHSALSQENLDGDSIPTSELESGLRANEAKGRKGKGTK